MDDFTMSSVTASFPLDQRALIRTHELMNMSTREARKKWIRLAEASGVDFRYAYQLAIFLALVGSRGGGPDHLANALDRIWQTKVWSDLEREKVLKFVQDTVVPNNIPCDDSHFSLLSFPFSHSRELLWCVVISARNLTLDKLMISPCTFQLDLDDEMRYHAKKGFRDYWSTIPEGPWANDIVRDLIYEKYSVNRYKLPSTAEVKSGPYSRSDLQEWLDTKSFLNLYEGATQRLRDRYKMDISNSATPQDHLLDMFGSLRLETDLDTDDEKSSMDTS